MKMKLDVDYVVPYVDGTDEEWQSQFLTYKQDCKYDDKLELTKRYSPNILFKYQFRGIQKFMPWIRTVHLLVSSKKQVPAWINSASVHIVEHREFIPADILPIFNSSTLECFLHRIPELAECFVYSNDDFYVTNYIDQSELFDSVMPKGSFHVRQVNPNNNESYERMNMIITKFICEKLGIPYQNWTFFIQDHVQRAMNKTIFKKIYDQFEKDILARCSRFRKDNNFSQAFFTMYYMCSTGFKYKTKIPYRRFDFFSGFNQMLQFFSNTSLKNFPKLLCLNNNDGELDIAILNKFEKLFPNKSKYEL